MRHTKAERPATASTVNRPHGDQLGGSISIQATKFSAAFQALFIDGRCAGHLISRGHRGVELFNLDDEPIGIFATSRAAADALSERGRRS